jgi:hypothetical protein
MHMYNVMRSATDVSPNYWTIVTVLQSLSSVMTRYHQSDVWLHDTCAAALQMLPVYISSDRTQALSLCILRS